ncbi:MAG: dicarboxylate/amino acid:cation symporter [Rhodospirillaceae bacterium]|nr:dicarboxylate/amino acid:cation symporter [Rhodospirillaceae bacterium]
MSRRFTLYILIGMIVGLVVGYICNENASPETAKTIAGYFSILTDIFLRLIKMIIAPLVFSTLVVGIVHVGDTASLSRIGFLTIGWFLSASIVSLLLGLLMVGWLQPGVGLDLPLPQSGASVAIKASSLTLKDFITHVFPKSFFEAMATNEILQIVVFSMFVGVALSTLGEGAKKITEILEQIVSMMLLITGYVMKFAPIAVFAAIAATVTTQGLGIITTYLKFIGGFYLSLGMLWGLLVLAGFAVIGKRITELVALIREPTLLAFSTASSEAAYPKTLERLEHFGVPKRIASFVLPLGYSFNLDGSMMYCTFATIFIAQAYGIDLTISQQLTMLMLLMLTSKGMAGVPRASLVVIAATLTFFGIPEEGLLLVLAVDQFLDMGRSATNVVGNAVATSVVAKWNDR